MREAAARLSYAGRQRGDWGGVLCEHLARLLKRVDEGV